MRKLITIISLLCPLICFAAETLNLYVWASQLPASVLHQFELETGIKINLSSYDSNEVMVTKLIANKNAGYDIVSPSTYVIEKLRLKRLLRPIDKSQIPNWRYLDPQFLNQPYDPDNTYSLPLQWGVTGIFVNTKYHDPKTIQTWRDLWQPRFRNQVLLLNDMREIFAMGLMQCGYDANDPDPEHIKAAYLKLSDLLANVKLFNSSAIIPLMTDDDVTVGMSWNGDVAKARLDNPNLVFKYPTDGFVLWIDSLVIPMHAPHPIAAHRFMNFLLRPEISAQLIEDSRQAVPNVAAKQHLSPSLQQNPVLYPNSDALKHGQTLDAMPPHSLQIMSHYWARLRIS